MNAPRSTTYTLVRSLVDAGLLEMAGDGNRVYFGKKLYLYGMDYVRGNDLLRRGRQEVDHLSRETGETSELCHAAEWTLHDCPFKSGHQAVSHQFRHRLADPAALDRVGPAAAGGPWTPDIEAIVSEDDLVLPGRPQAAARRFHHRHRAGGNHRYCVTSGSSTPIRKCRGRACLFGAGQGRGDDVPRGPIDTSEERTGCLLGLLRDRAARLSTAA